MRANIIKKNYVNYLFGAAVCITLGILSGLFGESGNSEWYQQLIKPSFNPPSWVFAPVWTILYGLMGITLVELWQQRKTYKTLLVIFFIQLGFNLIWSPLFFYFHRIDLALVDISLLWLTLLLFMFKAGTRFRILFLPYVLWVSFALVLNTAIFILN